jgi:hypothetical protein
MTQGTVAPTLSALLHMRLRRVQEGFHGEDFDDSLFESLGLSRDDSDQWSRVDHGLSGDGQDLVRENVDLVWIGKLHRSGGNSCSTTRLPNGFLDVRVDRGGSLVGNPFVGGPRAQVCRAFDAWLIVAMMLDDGNAWTDGDWTRVVNSMPEASAAERQLMLSIAQYYDVHLHPSYLHCSAMTLSTWVCHHARLSADGQRLRLLCCCLIVTSSSRPPIGLTCHAQSLAAAISWVAEQAPPLQLTSSTTTTERSTLLPSSVRAAPSLQRLAPMPCF